MRDATNKILEMIDEGLLDARAVAQMCLKYMSEDEVADMADANEIYFEVEDGEEEEEVEVDEDYPYVIKVGEDKDNLYPCFACKDEENAVTTAKNNTFYKYVEVVYMPEEDDAEVIWHNWEV